jgi:hypothetical protein
MVAVPVTPSLVARMVVPPAETAVTDPLVDTVAIAVLSLLHVTVRPVNTVFDASRVVAESCVVPPTAIVALLGDTLTLATGASVTVSVAEPVLLSLVATMFAVPAAFAVTRPLVLTVAMVVFELLHVMVRPVKVFPLASRSVATA